MAYQHKYAVVLLTCLAAQLPVARCFNPSIFSFPWKDVSRFPLRATRDITQIGSLTVPVLGVGTIAWDDNSDDINELRKVMSFARQNDLAFFDTAERYGGRLFGRQTGFGWGETEKLLQKLIQITEPTDPVLSRSQGHALEIEAKQRCPIICSKFTPTPWRWDAKSVVKACKSSCERLGVDSIDLYQIHMPDIVQPFRIITGNSPKDEIFWDGLAECYLSGIARNVGVCNYGPTLLGRAQEALAKRGVPLVSNQIAFSLLNRGNGAQATVDAGRALGIKTLAYYPLAMGILTGRYSALHGSHASSEGLSRSSLELKDLRMYGEGGKGAWGGGQVAEGGVRPLLSVMESIAAARRKSVAQVALNYVISKGAIPIPGARTVAQLEENMGAAGWRLTANEVRRLEKAADGLGFEFEGAGFKRAREKFVGYGVEQWSLD